MKEEQYNLVCRGELVHGFSQSTVAPEIEKLLKVKKNIALRIFDKKPRIIKRKVTWRQAIRYQHLFKTIGLVIHVNVILNADIFRESLIPQDVDNSATVEKQAHDTDLNRSLNNSFVLMKFSISRFIPSVFSSAHKESITDKEEKSWFRLESHSYTLNPKFLLLISLITSLIIQKYSSLLIVQHITEQASTLISLVIFFLIILLLPKAMSPNRIFTLRNSTNDSAYVLCTQVPNLDPFIDDYNIYTGNDKLIATVKNNRLNNKLTCQSPDGNILYSSTEEYDVDDVTKSAAREMRDELFDFSILQYISLFFSRLKKIALWFRKETYVYKKSDTFVIRDSSTNKIGYFYRGKISFMELPELCNKTNSSEKKGNETKALLAFTLICLGIS